jgi:hypothetical protein
MHQPVLFFHKSSARGGGVVAAAWAARAAEESGRGVVRLSLVLRRGVERERE